MEKKGLRPDPDDTLDLTDFSLRALRVFVAVEEAGAMALAAERLSASPSTVSQQISNLERAIGAKLLDRAARPIALTPAGRVLSRHARRILDAVGDARSDLMTLDLSSLPELRLGIIDDLDASITPDLVRHLKGLYPCCVFSAATGRSDVLTEGLLGRAVDMVMTAEPPRDLNSFEIFPLLREPFVLVTSKGLLEEGVDPIPQLTAAPFVHYDTRMPMGRAIQNHLRRLRLLLPQRYSFDASRSIFAMVRDSRGWAMTTPLSVLDSDRFRPDLDILPLPFAGFSRRVYLVARRAELGSLPEMLAALCRELLEERVLPQVHEMAPWTDRAFRVLGQEAEEVIPEDAYASGE